MLKKVLLLNFLLLLCSVSFNAQAPIAAKKAVKPDTAAVRRQSFEKVWNTINEKHFDPTFGGVDWQKARKTYEPLAAAAKSDAEFHAILNKMLGELKLSHFAVFLPPVEAKTSETSAGATGIDLKMLDGIAVVSRIAIDSTAEKSALKTGFVIEKVNNKTTAELLAPLEKYFAGRAMPEALRRLYQERTLLNAINGNAGTSAKIEVLDGKNQTQIFNVRRVEHKAEMSLAVGNFPAQEVVFEAKRLADNVGYIRFNMWIIPQMSKIKEAIRSMNDADGIIFDVRGNPGGIGGMATGIAGLLVNEQTSLGTMKSRETETKFVVYPQSNSYNGKVVVLTDYGSASTSEIFAAGLQEIGRAEIVGETTAGAVLPSIFDRLPTGAIFQYVVSDYKSPKNILIENRGVIPDIEAKQTRKALLEGRDAQLEKAIEEITKKSKKIK